MFHVVIPARFAATRLPGKPLLPIAGKPLVQWVWERARASGAASVTVATDDARIRDAATAFGADCVMTASTHASGTDRVAEVVRVRGFTADAAVINLQGDEPMTPPPLIAGVAAALQPGVDIATAVAPIRSLEEFVDPNCVKAVRSSDGRALYFSRAPIPWPRDASLPGEPRTFTHAWRHIGIYGYRVRSLLEFAARQPSLLEVTEKLEQLRALEAGMRVQLVVCADAPAAGVDTPADLQRVEAQLLAR